MTPQGIHIETVIIGGGQAGLAVGYHLARRGRPFVILEAGERIGDSWRKRWDSLRVFTPARYDGLPGWSFPVPAWSYPTKDAVADYLESYAARFRLPVRTGIRVDKLSREGGGYGVTSELSWYEADNVVVATGGYQSPRIPVFASELDPNIVQLHSSEYRNPAQLRDGAVLVVGAGNSGAEIALESSARHLTWLCGRDTGQEPFARGTADRLFTPPFWFLLSHVLTVRTPIGRRARDQLSGRGLPLARVRRKDLTRAGIERVPRLTGVRDGLPMLADGVALAPANVIWCTGFVPDFSWIDPRHRSKRRAELMGSSMCRTLLHRPFLPVHGIVVSDWQCWPGCGTLRRISPAGVSGTSPGAWRRTRPPAKRRRQGSRVTTRPAPVPVPRHERRRRDATLVERLFLNAIGALELYRLHGRQLEPDLRQIAWVVWLDHGLRV
jgi:putative flavoprotein involved in K+ transport